MKLSIIIPIHNEADCLEKNIAGFIRYFKKHPQVEDFKIILIENGSTDSTLAIAGKLKKKYHAIILFTIPQRSLGLALSEGVKKAGYPYVYFDAIDNPFKFEDLEKFLTKIEGNDLVFASKNNPHSRYEKRPLRKIASRVYSFLIRLFFHLPLTDTQGTFLGRKEKLLPLLPFCTSQTAFFQTQLAIFAVKNKLKVTEVPIRYIPESGQSHFSFPTDGTQLLFELFREKLLLYF